MKSFLALLIGGLCLCSCKAYGNYFDETPIDTLPNVGQDRRTFEQIFEFEYKGHQYIWFRCHNGGYAGFDGGIVHNPECNACRGKEDTTIQYRL